MTDAVSVLNLVMLFFLMLGLGIAVNVEAFLQNFKKPKGITVGLLCQFVLMPPLAYAMGGIFGLKNIHRIALVLLGCCPGGAMSNILCFLSRADIDLSVAMTTASSFGAIVMMPLNIYLYVEVTGLSNEVSLDFVGIVVSALLVVAGLGLGISIKKWAATNEERGPLALKIVAKLGTLGGFGTVLSSLIANAQSETPIYAAPGKIYCATFIQVVVGICLGFGLSSVVQLPKPSCVAVSIETSVQNAILALAIIAISFNSDDAGAATVVPMCYMAFSTWTCVLWTLLAWKVFGFTGLDRNATWADIMNSYKSSTATNNDEETKEEKPRDDLELL